jgi:imidazolonepropionase-like amidohydrolase
VLRATREQLMKGASQVKIVAGGGASSVYDPIDVTQYLPEEIEAAVLAAADWGTYVMAHVYTANGIKRCIKAGVRTIEHGNIADEEAVQMMADAGTIWSLQPLVEENANPTSDPVRRGKQMVVWEGTDTSYKLAQKHGVHVGWGTDILFDLEATERQGKILSYMTRWFTPAQALIGATSGNAFILGQSGPRNPYPGVLGAIQKWAHADLLLVEGDPTENLELIADPDANFRIIMKGGTIHKNTL